MVTLCIGSFLVGLYFYICVNGVVILSEIKSPNFIQSLNLHIISSNTNLTHFKYFISDKITIPMSHIGIEMPFAFAINTPNKWLYVTEESSCFQCYCCNPCRELSYMRQMKSEFEDFINSLIYSFILNIILSKKIYK